jgi:hypothetical protein
MIKVSALSSSGSKGFESISVEHTADIRIHAYLRETHETWG